MVRIIRVLNNNALLVVDKQTGQEKILLGKGIGFGKKAEQNLEDVAGAKEYELKGTHGATDAITQVKGIEPVYLEAAGWIIDEAERVFGRMNREILVLLAEHIAFAAKRERDHIAMSNPFIADIKVVFAREYAVALSGREQVENLTGFHMSDGEVGFIALHIHSGLAGEGVSETLRNTQIIDSCVQMISQALDKNLAMDSTTYGRLVTHLYHLMERVRTGEAVKLELNDFIAEQYPLAWAIAGSVCEYISKQLGKAFDLQERGFLAIYIERFRVE